MRMWKQFWKLEYLIISTPGPSESWGPIFSEYFPPSMSLGHLKIITPTSWEVFVRRMTILRKSWISTFFVGPRHKFPDWTDYQLGHNTAGRARSRVFSPLLSTVASQQMVIWWHLRSCTCSVHVVLFNLSIVIWKRTRMLCLWKSKYHKK